MIAFKRIDKDTYQILDWGGHEVGTLRRVDLFAFGPCWQVHKTGSYYVGGTVSRSKKIAREVFGDTSHPLDRRFFQALVDIEAAIERKADQRWPAAYSAELESIRRDVAEFRKQYYGRFVA